MIVGELQQNTYGHLSIWEQPVAGLQYALGVDTSSGLRESVKEGDASAACVIEVRTCRQVAEMHGYMDPTLWGWACARLGWLYNSAWIAIETQPSQHGLTAFIAAERYNYPNLIMQQRRELVNGRMVERRGWVRPARSLGPMYDRIRDAMREDCPIRSVGLLDELAAVRFEEGKFRSDEHDDRVIAYGIALLLRDQLYSEGMVVTPKEEAQDISDLYWQRELAEGTPETARTYEQEWDGY